MAALLQDLRYALRRLRNGPGFAAMVLATTALAIGTSAGCTSLHAVQMPKEDVQEQIASGQLLKPGDRVRLTTADGKVHDFAVTAVDAADGTIKGARDSVRIAEVTTVAKRRVSVGKTLGLVFGVLIGVQVTHDVAEVVTGNYIM